MTRKRGLGKGLDALIPNDQVEMTTTTGALEISIQSIQPNPRQPRKNFDEEELRSLAESIQQHGVLQPLIASPDESGMGYLLIAGERRLQAAQIAGLDSVPVIVRQVAEQERLELALVENLQRTDLNPLEAANGYQQLMDDFNLSHEEIARRVGKSRAAVTNTLRLQKLSSGTKQALLEGKISEGHARALLGLQTAQAQTDALTVILDQKLSVRQTEDLVKKLGDGKVKKSSKPKLSAEEADLERRLQEALGTRVSLRKGSRGGSLQIHFYSDEELNAIVDQLLLGLERD
jgi:ParB family chromosome partitioning protein